MLMDMEFYSIPEYQRIAIKYTWCLICGNVYDKVLHEITSCSSTRTRIHSQFVHLEKDRYGPVLVIETTHCGVVMFVPERKSQAAA